MAKNFNKKLQELLYSFNTNDRYAGFSGTNNDTIHKSTKTSYKSPKLTSPILNNSFNSSITSLTQEFDIQNEGVSETILAWRHIELWTNKHHNDLRETLNPPVTRNDISVAERDLNIEFPASVVTSLRIHDGQDFSGSFKDYCGLFFTLELMSLDKIVEMTKNWRKVSVKINDSIQKKLNSNVLKSLKSPELTHDSKFHKNNNEKRAISQKNNYQPVESMDYDVNPNLEDSISKITLNYDITDKSINLNEVKSNLNDQTSIPPNTIHDTYVHRDWIPLLTDNSGNHVAIDLSPGAKGKYGQVILFGREFDVKYVVADNWGDFILSFAKDLENGNYLIRNDETVDDIMSGEGELCYYDKQLKREISYFTVLKNRAINDWELLKVEISKNVKQVKETSLSQDYESHLKDELLNDEFTENILELNNNDEIVEKVEKFDNVEI